MQGTQQTETDWKKLKNIHFSVTESQFSIF